MPCRSFWLHQTIHGKLLKLPDSREVPLITVCAAGMRAPMGGSILQRDGRDNVEVLAESGTGAWIDQGYSSATGEE